MAKILKSYQSDGGFSVAEETIIDPQRNVLKANSIEVVNNSFFDASKKEFITFNTANDVSTTVNLNNFTTVNTSEIIFSKASIVLSWKGYSIAQYNVNANSSIARITLDGHGLSIGDSVTLSFDQQGSGSNGTYTVTNVINDVVFDVDTGIVFNPIESIVNGNVELENYGLYWEYSIEITTTCLSNSTNILSLAGISTTILKDNIPPGHTWEVYPTINNVTKQFGYQVNISSNGTLENHSSGVDCVGFITNVITGRE